MLPTSRIEVDLSAIHHNVTVIRKITRQGNEPSKRIGLCAVLKADGYGLGGPRIARLLAQSGIDLIAVHRPDQARELVESAVMTPILVMMPVRELERVDTLYRFAARGLLHLTVHDDDTLDALVATADGHGMFLPVHIEIDTGMSRGGAPPDDAARLVERIATHRRLKLAGIFNHLSSADSGASVTDKQRDAFSSWLDEHKDAIPPDCLIHEANTFGLLRSAAHHRSMVRVGLALLGYGAEELGRPEDFEFASEARELRPCLRWLSRIVQTKWIKRGTPVGYRAAWRAKKKTRLGLVPVGYADGYPLALWDRAQVGIILDDGQKAFAPIVGRISMDQLVVDLTALPEERITVGAEVELVGNDRDLPNHLPTLAAQAGTITHELLCRLSPRLKRTYISSEKPKPIDIAVKPIVPTLAHTVAV